MDRAQPTTRRCVFFSRRLVGRVWDTIKQHIWVNGSAEATFFDDENEEANKEGISDEEYIPMGEKQQILILLFWFFDQCVHITRIVDDVLGHAERGRRREREERERVRISACQI